VPEYNTLDLQVDRSESSRALESEEKRPEMNLDPEPGQGFSFLYHSCEGKRDLCKADPGLFQAQIGKTRLGSVSVS
jgi:hypothetical protein